MPCDIIIFAAHPDDAELGCGGTIARFKAEGRSVVLVDLTMGEMGTRGTPEIRKKELSNASEVLKIDHRIQLDLGDSELYNTRENQEEIIQIIRTYRPVLAVTGAPDDRHSDHRKATRLVTDALFYSGLEKWITFSEDGAEQDPWRPNHVIQYMQDRPFEPDFIMDITGFWETKVQSIKAFESQFDADDSKDEPQTYISSKSFFKQIESRARYFGHLGGFEFGEPFLYHNGPIGFPNSDLFFDHKRKS